MNKFQRCSAMVVALFVTTGLYAQASDKPALPISSGQKIAFLGDSITAAGARPNGYCRLVIAGLGKQGVEVSGIFAGVSGHKSNQMLARLEKDVLSKQPDWMTLSCGVNDVWHGARGVPIDAYRTNITAIVDQAQSAGVKVMLLTSTMIKEDQAGPLNQKLLPYNAFIRELAAEKSCLLGDLNAEMQSWLKTFPEDSTKGKELTRDGVHMNALGNIMMATGILKGFGLSEATLSGLVQEWKNTPGSKSLRLNLSMSLNEYEALSKKLDKPVQTAFEQFLNEKKEALLGQE